MQIAFVLEATRSAGRALLDSHLRHSATAAVRSGEPAHTEAMYKELLDLVYRTARQRLDPGQAVSPGIGCDPVG